MPWTGLPTRVDEHVVQILLNIADELLDARSNAECRDIRTGIAHDRSVTPTVLGFDPFPQFADYIVRVAAR